MLSNNKNFNNRAIKNTHLEKRVFTFRLSLAIFLIMAFLLLVIGRLTYLQIANFEHYSELAKGNRIRIEPIPPNRGLIFDRNGVILAENIPTYELVLIPEEVSNTDIALSEINQVIPLSEEQVERFKKRRKRFRSFEQVPVLYNLDENELAKLAANLINLDGVHIRARLARHYPKQGDLVHTIGYVGSINDKEIKEIDSRAYSGTSHIGKTGIEKAYENQLLGTVGYRQVLVNAQGRTLEVIEENAPKSGSDIYLTIDTALQATALKAMDGRRGAVVAIDPSNGDILTMLSSPTFDGNGFSRGLSQADFDELLKNRDKPLLNRALAGLYPPGSTIKPMLGLAGLEAGKVSHQHTTYCPGFFKLPNHERPFRDWKRQGHGQVNLNESIEQSCDIYFYELALELGIEKMHSYLKQFQLGVSIHPGIEGSKRGVLPNKAWKRENFKKPADQVWFPGETVIAGIGQGFMTTTPLQLATATSILSMQGEYHPPHLVRSIENKTVTTDSDNPQETITNQLQSSVALTAKQYNWDEVIDGMRAVIHGDNGTARAVQRQIDFEMAGKSGTAQVFTLGEDQEYDPDEIEERLRDHALFIAFAPIKDPKIAVAIIVENGGGGSTAAAPIATQVIQTHLANLGLSKLELASPKKENIKLSSITQGEND